MPIEEIEIQIPYNYREYEWEVPIVKAFNRGLELWMNLHRRAGKDLFCFCRCLLPAALKRPGTYHFIWPTLKQGRDSFWEGKDEEGRDILSNYIPQKLIVKKDNQDMKLIVSAVGGTSTIQIFGTNNGQYEALRGKPGNGAVFSEYAYQDPRGYDVVAPMLRKTRGWAVFNSTPNGSNHFKVGYYNAVSNPRCYAVTKTITDTYDHEGRPLISPVEIEEERKRGKSDDYIQQEYYCSFVQGVEGTYLGRQLQEMRNEGRIGNYTYDEHALVNTAWDLGVADFMAIIFYQVLGNRIHIIDYYEASGYGFAHYARVLKEKGYLYGIHTAPHDILVREMGGSTERAFSRLQKAEEVGIRFEVLPLSTFANDVENARAVMNRVYMNEATCGTLIAHLEQWGRVFSEVAGCYSDVERHDIHSHAGAAFRYMATAVTENVYRPVEDYHQRSMDGEYLVRHCSKYNGFG